MNAEPIRVLIVDDGPPARNTLKALLATWQRVGEIREAEDGCQAVKAVRESLPHVMVMHIRQPEIDSLKATVKIKALWPQVKVVILSMYADYRRDALAAGADAFVGKAEAPQQLLPVLARLLSAA